MVSIRDLRPNRKYDWTTIARVSKKWIERNTLTETVTGLHLILVDEYHDRIYVRIGETLWSHFYDQLLEGNIYEFRNFVVKHYQEDDIERSFKDDVQDLFSIFTTFSHIRNHSSHIPMHVWMFTELEDIPRENPKQNYLIDVIGIVHSVDPIQHTTSTYQITESYIDFYITNTVYYVKARFSNNFATLFDLELNKAKELPAVVVISSCKVVDSSTSTMSAVISTPASTFHVNPD